MRSALVPPITPKSLGQDLCKAVAPWGQLNRWVSLGRFGSLGLVCLGSTAIAWQLNALGGFVFWTGVAAIAYGFWLVCIHDAVHQTLTGWRRVDLWLARSLAWPIAWPAGVYSELHGLHHRWNGRDLRDPERIQWSRAEYQAASPLRRWYVRHQWAWDILVAGALGLIWDIFRQGWTRRGNRPQVLPQMRLDVLGILLTHSSLLLWVSQTGAWAHYGLFWLIVTWIVGIMMQTRAHLEHYGRWQPQASPLLTQLYSARNVNGRCWVNWLMGGLPYHAVHHAFPHIPFEQLPQAYVAIQTVLQQHQQIPLTLEAGYWQTTIQEIQHYSLIETQ
ncbi:MAG: fatty acid desaturase [Cyanobacteria bacterium P01_G01_bin.54]